MPILTWLPNYRREWLGFDALAGITLAAYAIPVSLAYAALAGLPPEAGLYSYLVGGLAYAVFGSSRHLAIGPTSAISLAAGLTLARLAADQPGSLLPLTALATLMTAAVFGLAWLVRGSVVVDFISESILTGFKAGAALSIAVTQVPKLLGISGGGESFFARVALIVEQTPHARPVTLVVGLVAVALLVWGERRWPGRPIALGVVVLSLVAVPWLALRDQGVTVVGAIPPGLPAPGFPTGALLAADAVTWRGLVQLAFACFLLSYIESISAARTLAQRRGYDVDAQQELVGLGAANLAAGVFQGYPLAGGLSQSAVNECAGARTPLALVCASAALALVLSLLTGLFRNLPSAILAAVVLVAVAGLVDIREFRHLARVSRLDFYAAVIAFAAVLLMGILDGVIFAVIASLLLLLRRTATPNVAFLGRIPGTNRFSDLARHPDNETLRGVLAFRAEAALLYFNVDHVRNAVLQRVRSCPDPLRLVVCDLSNSPYVDLAGARMLARLHEDLASRGTELRVVEAHATARDLLRAEGLDHMLGPLDRRRSLADLLEEAGPATNHAASSNAVPPPPPPV